MTVPLAFLLDPGDTRAAIGLRHRGFCFARKEKPPPEI